MKKSFRRPSAVFNLNPIRFVDGQPIQNPLEWKLTDSKTSLPACTTSQAKPRAKLPPIPNLPIVSAPRPQPQPTFVSVPRPQPQPTFVSVPRPQPSFVSAPQPPAFVSAPQPQPQPTFVSAPQPQPQPTFVSAPQPQPQPTFVSVPRPQPQPTFVSAPQPQPQPRPSFASAPQPQPQPQPSFASAPLNTEQEEPPRRQPIVPPSFASAPLNTEQEEPPRQQPIVPPTFSAPQKPQFSATPAPAPERRIVRYVFIRLKNVAEFANNIAEIWKTNALSRRLAIIGADEDAYECFYTVNTNGIPTIAAQSEPSANYISHYLYPVKETETVLSRWSGYFTFISFRTQNFHCDERAFFVNYSRMLSNLKWPLFTVQPITNDDRVYNQVLAQKRGYFYADMKAVYLDPQMLHSAVGVKVEYMLSVIRNSPQTRFYILSAYVNSLEKLGVRLTAAGVSWRWMLYGNDLYNPYEPTTIDSSVQVMMQQYDPLIGQANSYFVNEITPGPWVTYFMEMPINSLAFQYLAEMKYIDNATVLMETLGQSKVMSSDEYFYERIKKDYGI